MEVSSLIAETPETDLILQNLSNFPLHLRQTQSWNKPVHRGESSCSETCLYTHTHKHTIPDKPISLRSFHHLSLDCSTLTLDNEVASNQAEEAARPGTNNTINQDGEQEDDEEGNSVRNTRNFRLVGRRFASRVFLFLFFLLRNSLQLIYYPQLMYSFLSVKILNYKYVTINNTESIFIFFLCILSRQYM